MFFLIDLIVVAAIYAAIAFAVACGCLLGIMAAEAAVNGFVALLRKANPAPAIAWVGTLRVRSPRAA